MTFANGIARRLGRIAKWRKAPSLAPRCIVYTPAWYPTHLYVAVGGALAYAKYRHSEDWRHLDLRIVPLGYLDYVWKSLLDLRRRYRSSGRRPFVNGRMEQFEIDGRKITVRRESQRIGSLVSFFKTVLALPGLWSSCFHRGRFRPTSFLNISYRGVAVGDAAASEYLRRSREPIAALKGRPLLWLLLAESVFIVNFAADRLEVNPDSAVFSLELTYRDAIYKRILKRRGASVIGTRSYDSNTFVFVDADNPLPNFYVARPSLAAASEEDRREVDSYLSDRINNPPRTLGYMTSGFNRSDLSEIRSCRGELVDPSRDKATVVVFLNSFADAQYYFGLDGFADLLEWSDFTIRACLSNAAISGILLKPHPNIRATDEHKSKASEEWLHRRYRDEPRVVWMDPRTSLRALAQIEGLTAIIHHGSVAEELVYLGIPVMSWKSGPWRAGYDFVRAWKDIGEYRRMLLSLNRDNYERVSPQEREALVRYIKEYRLRNPEYANDLFWVKRWIDASCRASAFRSDEDLSIWAAHLQYPLATDLLTFLAREVYGVEWKPARPEVDPRPIDRAKSHSATGESGQG